MLPRCDCLRVTSDKCLRCPSPPPPPLPPYAVCGLYAAVKLVLIYIIGFHYQ